MSFHFQGHTEAWHSRPEVFLTAEVAARPQKGALAQWALQLEEVQLQLKALSSQLLWLQQHPEHQAAAVQDRKVRR